VTTSTTDAAVTADVTTQANVVIIGGGIIGLATAYHLACVGVDDVLLVERNQLTSGTSWHAAGIVGPLRATMNMTRLAMAALTEFPALERETGLSTGYRTTGGAWLARNKDRMHELHRIARIGEMSGLGVELLDTASLKARVPLLETAGLVGALWVNEDGRANAVDICMAYAAAARARGVRLVEGVTVCGIESRDGSVRAVRTADGARIECTRVVNCAGAWAKTIGDMAGVPVPLQAVQHMYVVTSAVPKLPSPFPVLRDLDAGLYIKEEPGRLVLGGFEQRAKTWDPQGVDGDRAFLEMPEDWDHFEPFMEAALERLPTLNDIGIQHFMNGPESFTPDTRPLLGESPYLRGFFVAAGFNSTGMMSSAGAGQVMARWINDGAPPYDLWDVDIARFERAHNASGYLNARIPESVGDVFNLHWPHKQTKSGRDLRRLVLHQQLEDAGAVFGSVGGWERPLWYASNGVSDTPAYSFGEQPWWPAAASECQQLKDGVGLLELSPFTKIDVKGKDALSFMQFAFCTDMDRATGRAVYALALNRDGGIEAEATVTRFAKHHFRVTGGVATRAKDVGWLTRLSQDRGANVSIEDVTESEAVLGIMGPYSRDVLSQLTGEDLATPKFPYGTSRVAAISGVSVRLTRLSYVGELGWEIYMTAADTADVFEALVQAGKEYNITPIGHYALDACRLEKGYVHWGHDIGPKDTPHETGLAFAVSKLKLQYSPGQSPSGQSSSGQPPLGDTFLGQSAVQAQQSTGVSRRLTQFAVCDAHPLLLHDEPLLCNGELVGRTTSGGRGFRTDLSLCFGYLPCEPGAATAVDPHGHYEVVVGDETFTLRPLHQSAYDHARRFARA
jgi:glycine cleavage system aminomethyltransferase T/glycine/D-amino acid oxidase-like deaminating enzyme